jgi:hypothetical protein
MYCSAGNIHVCHCARDKWDKCRWRQIYTQFSLENLKEKDHSEHLRVDERIILKSTLNKYDVTMFGRFSRQRVGSSERGNVAEGSTDTRQFVQQLGDQQGFENDSAPLSWHNNNQSPDDVFQHLRRHVNTFHTAVEQCRLALTYEHLAMRPARNRNAFQLAVFHRVLF